MEISEAELNKKLEEAAAKAIAAADVKFQETTNGLVKKNEELLTEVKGLKEREQKRLESAKSEEDKKLLKDGNIEEFINRKLAERTSEADNQIKVLKTAKEEAEARVEAAERERTQDKLDRVIMEEATKAKIQPSAIKDVIYRANGSFKLNDAGIPVLKDEQGNIKYATDGTTPIVASAWLETLKTDAPHLWGTSTGTGLTGHGAENGAFAMTQSEIKKDPRAYFAMQDKAKEKGAEVQILEG